MNEFKTKAGTVLPMMNLKGKAYLMVAHRLVWFREEHPLGRIDTECVESTEKYVIYKATISIPSRDQYVKLADGYKREDYAHFGDAHEKASTGAIGRALALCGYGTQFAPEFDEEERLADSPVQRPRITPQPTNSTALSSSSAPLPTPKGNAPIKVDPNKLVTEAQLKRLFALSREHGWDNEHVKDLIFTTTGKESSKELTMGEYDVVCSTIQGTS